MIDTVSLSWGHEGFVRIDWDDLVERFAGEKGRVTEITPTGDRRWRVRHHSFLNKTHATDNRSAGCPSPAKRYGSWKVGDITLMPGRESGRVEVRASLPKVLMGRNDVLLDRSGVHDALREVVGRASELLRVDLSLEDARPFRLDYVYQWEVDSVAGVLGEVRKALKAPRKDLTEWVSRTGALGRSLYYGLGTKDVWRFYDKAAEVAQNEIVSVAHGIEPEEFDDLIDPELLRWMSPGERKAQLDLAMRERERKVRNARRDVREQILRDANIDELLRFERQDRRPKVVRRIHADGYQPLDVLTELRRPLESLESVVLRSFEDILAAETGQHRIGNAIAKWALSEHPELLPVLRKEVHRNTYSRWRKRARESAVRTWAPEIADDAFGDDVSAWEEAA